MTPRSRMTGVRSPPTASTSRRLRRPAWRTGALRPRSNRQRSRTTSCRCSRARGSQRESKPPQRARPGPRSWREGPSPPLAVRRRIRAFPTGALRGGRTLASRLAPRWLVILARVCQHRFDNPLLPEQSTADKTSRAHAHLRRLSPIGRAARAAVSLGRGRVLSSLRGRRDGIRPPSDDRGASEVREPLRRV
jgi:hypothetical protein